VSRGWLYRIVVDGWSCCCGQHGQRPSASRPSRTLAHDVAVAQSPSCWVTGRRRWRCACRPSCGARFVYRQGAGESVRSWALRVSEDGCECSGCRAFWPPEEFHWLARLLGCVPLPS